MTILISTTVLFGVGSFHTLYSPGLPSASPISSRLLSLLLSFVVRSAFSTSSSTLMPSDSSRASQQLYHFDDEDSVDQSDSQQSQSTRRKSSGACVECKSVKVKCEYVVGEGKCRRCKSKNLVCKARNRKKRKPADTHEQLQERSHERDIQIQKLLSQLDEMNQQRKIHQWVSKIGSNESELLDIYQRCDWKGKSPDVAVAEYFELACPPYQTFVPGIVKHCSLYPSDIMELFSIYFERINPYFSLLDVAYHTPKFVIERSPFLFTVICAVASRHYQKKPAMYPLAMEFARDLAGQSLVQDHKSIEICQAYLILAVYPVPKKKWVEDKSWLLMGVAIRMAMRLELNQPPLSSCDPREQLNRTRTWLNCYCVDGSHAIQFGKIPMLNMDDFIARNSRSWYKSSSLVTPYDVHLCGYVQMLMIMARWRTKVRADGSSPNMQADEVVKAALATQEILSREMDEWNDLYAEEMIRQPLNICSYRGNTTLMISAYLRLVVLLAGFQRTRAEDLRHDSEILVKCIDAARSVIQITLQRLYPTGFLRYAMEANFLYLAFATAFLINLFRPRYLHLLNQTLRQEIITDVAHLVTILGSDEVALDGRHTPALYSRFLSSMMGRYRMDEHIFNLHATDGLARPSGLYQDRHSTPADSYYWPDVPISAPNFDNFSVYPGSSTIDMEPKLDHGVGMDFSLTHFMRTVGVTGNNTPPAPFVSSSLPDTWEVWPAPGHTMIHAHHMADWTEADQPWRV
ncbi:fungal-specific transcription factor domain-containing protein [Panaeolus papilionaceus]|nr:fungal-specific transcription factor domain-containing protein [Panaeolus papilionaceus]